MKKEKVTFDKIDRFKELIELTGLVSYTVESDAGRDILIEPVCVKEHNLNSNLQDFLYDFHTDCLYSAEGSAEIQIIKNDVQMIWSESRDLLLEYIEDDFNEMLCALFSLPSKSSIEIFKLNFEISGTIKSNLEFDKFVFILQVNPNDISEGGFSHKEIHRIKAGLLFKNSDKIRSRFKLQLKKLLNKYSVSNCTFSLSRDGYLLYFFVKKIEDKRIIISISEI